MPIFIFIKSHSRAITIRAESTQCSLISRREGARVRGEYFFYQADSRLPRERECRSSKYHRQCVSYQAVQSKCRQSAVEAGGSVTPHHARHATPRRDATRRAASRTLFGFTSRFFFFPTLEIRAFRTASACPRATRVTRTTPA